MARMGHLFYLCDKKSGATDQSRAVLMTARTVEILARLRIAHHFLKEAIICQGTQAYADGDKVGIIDHTK